MKRRLIILSILFLALIVLCFYYPVKNTGMHIALMVQFSFFIHYLVVKPADRKKIKRDIVSGKEEPGTIPREQKKKAAAKNT